MSEDKRELILARLVAIAEAIEDIKEVVRNEPSLDDVILPAIAIFDGDEEVDQTGNDANSPGRAPNIVHMSPQMSIVLADKTEDSGTSLNIFRARLIKAVLFDATLAALAGTGGGRSTGNVRYAGITPAVFEGRLLIGRMNTHFRISYTLHPANL